MTSDKEKKYGDGKSVFIDIYEKIEKIPTNEPNGDRVCICHIPKSLSSSKPEAFIPQFVGLGPYHHFKADLMMTEELKLGVAKRVLKLKENMEMDMDMDIQPFYHVDEHLTNRCRNLYVLTVDGLFLLALLHTAVEDIHEGPKSSQTYFLTGKPGMSLVNDAGVELTIDGIFMDVFLIGNQIPTQVLKHINKVNVNVTVIPQESTESTGMVPTINNNNSVGDIPSPDNDLGSAMKFFCESLCPLVHSNSLPINPEDHDHLLDLMYHLVVEPEPEAEPEPEPPSEFESLIPFILVPFFYLVCIVFWVILLPMLVMQILRWIVLFLVHKVFSCMPAPSVDTQNFNNIRKTAFYLSISYPAMLADALLGSYSSRFLRNMENLPFFSLWNQDEMIPTATKLYLPWIIWIVPAEGGIASIKYDRRRFQLPRLKLNVTSENIVRNLVAYEYLMKSNDLIFTGFISLMCALIHTADDACLLIRNGIIQTSLSGEAVAQIFNALRNSIKPVYIQMFEQEIIKARLSFHRFYYSVRLIRDFGFDIFIWFMIYYFVLPFVVSVTTIVYCFFQPNSKSCIVDELGGNHYFRSSM